MDSEIIKYASLAVLGIVSLRSLLLMLSFFTGVYEKTRFRSKSSDLFDQLIKLKYVALPPGKKSDHLGWKGSRTFEIQKKKNEHGDICSFELIPQDRKPLPSFHPGQYLTFSLHVHQKRKPITRSYSLSDGYHKKHYRISVKRQLQPRDKPEVLPGLSSNYFHDSLHENDTLIVKAPAGDFFLKLDEREQQGNRKPIVLIGGGVGITPVLSMGNSLAKENGTDQKIYFFYGVRNQEEYAMREDLDAMVKNLKENLHFYVCYSAPGTDDATKLPKPTEEKKGIVEVILNQRISIKLFEEKLPSKNCAYYICGPPPMMESIVNGLANWGVPNRDVHYESFGPASVKN